MSTIALFERRGKPQFWPNGLGVGKPLELHASVREEHGLAFAKSREPIAAGGVITDHVLQQPDLITLDVVMTRHPDTIIPNLVATLHKRLWRKLQDLAKRREPVDVMTSLRIYTDMIFTRVRTPRTADNTNMLISMCTLEKAEFATIDAASNLADAALDGMLTAEDLGVLTSAAQAGTGV